MCKVTYFLYRKSSLEKLNNTRDKTEAWKEILDKFNSITEENLSMKQIQKKWNNFKTNQKKKNSDKDFDDEVKTDVLKTFGKVNYLLVIISCFDIIGVDPLISGNF